MKNKFVILVTQRDAKPFIKKCLDSIVSQTYKNYFVIIMDDNSTDGTWEIIQTYPFQAIHTPKRDYHIKNFIAGINGFVTDREDIICFVSGDDYLYSDDVLFHLNEVYQNEDIWLTYGSYIKTSDGQRGECCQPIKDTRTYRKSRTWITSHLITCRKKLWDKINDKDLRYKNGQYPNNSFDNAMMYPMVEMAGLKHLRYIEKITYAYNDQNPVAAIHFKEDPKACLRERNYWISKPSYVELKEL
jgi:glycosyltransferase involved in cell wall biosynthesis